MDKITGTLGIVLITLFVGWSLYVDVFCRFAHPELTETQLQLKFISAGLYDPLENTK